MLCYTLLDGNNGVIFKREKVKSRSFQIENELIGSNEVKIIMYDYNKHVEKKTVRKRLVAIELLAHWLISDLIPKKSEKSEIFENCLYRSSLE